MEITELKRWHWAVLGAGVGALMAYAWTGHEPEEGRNAGALFFQQVGQVSDVPATAGMPLISNITVEKPTGDAYGKQVQRVRFTYLNTDKAGRAVYLPAHVIVQLDQLKGWPSVNALLDDYRKGASPESAKAAAYSTPLAENAGLYYGTWVGGGLLVLGGVWPTMVNLVVGAGLAPRKAPKEKKFKLSAYKGKGDIDDGTIKDKKPGGVTAADKEQLDAVMAKYEQSAGGSAVSTAGVATAAQTEQAIRKLEGGPVRDVVPAKTEEEPKDFKGEWYPVARPKKHD